MKCKLVLALFIVSAFVFPLPVIAEGTAPKISHLPEGPRYGQDDIDIAWLKDKIRSVLRENRVLQIRDGREVTYHAPYLHPMEEPPSGLPKWLHWAWKVWWHIKEPWQVRYPHQFFWDSCVQAVTLSYLNINMAEKEVASLLAAQKENGFIPHMIWNLERFEWLDRVLKAIYPSEDGSPFLQSPNLAQAVEHILQESGDVDFVRKVLPKLEKFYSYIDRVRCRAGDVLPEIIISYESGKDRSPEYDEVYGRSNAVPAWMGPMAELMFRYWRMGWDIESIFKSNLFRVKDLLFSCIYSQNLDAMSRLYSAVGDKAQSRIFKEKARETERAILAKMYDKGSGLFYSLDARYGRDKLIKVNTVSSLMPLVLDTISKEKVERLINDHLLNPNEFWTKYPVPANPLNSDVQKHEGHIVWRGKNTWLFTNWYIANGLRKQASRFPEHAKKYNSIADEIVHRSYELIRREGFREYYDARTGKGGGARNFGPSSIILDMILNNRPH